MQALDQRHLSMIPPVPLTHLFANRWTTHCRRSLAVYHDFGLTKTRNEQQDRGGIKKPPSVSVE
jgi:4-hydroxy-L-threonine phosphate dehydrogenase PdxA